MFTSNQTAIASKPAHSRSRLSNLRPAISARSAVGRRVRDLGDAAAAACGGWDALDPLRAAQVRRFAELSALVEQRRHAALAGSPLASTELVALETMVTKLGREIGLTREK